jgi:hypothetical protein
MRCNRQSETAHLQHFAKHTVAAVEMRGRCYSAEELRAKRKSSVSARAREGAAQRRRCARACLAAVCIGPGVGHGQKSRLRVLDAERLILRRERAREGSAAQANHRLAEQTTRLELLAIDRLAARAVAGCEVTACEEGTGE